MLWVFLWGGGATLHEVANVAGAAEMAKDMAGFE